MSPHNDRWERTSSTPSSSDDDLRATKEMCHYCFEILLQELTPSDNPVASSRNQQQQQNQHHHVKKQHARRLNGAPSFAGGVPSSASCPIFVTWDKRRGSSVSCSFELRGCIGTLVARPLSSAIREYALTSAFRDRRFCPIQKEEIPLLRVAVSLLVKYEECEDCFDWAVGTHGILIRFNDSHGQYSATYLPEVASDQGWDQQQTINSLVRKAGYKGEISTDLITNIHCTRYQSSKDRMTYQEYVNMLGSDPLLSAATPTTTTAIVNHTNTRSVGWKTCMNL